MVENWDIWREFGEVYKKNIYRYNSRLLHSLRTDRHYNMLK